jgi:hypothetical protein
VIEKDINRNNTDDINDDKIKKNADQLRHERERYTELIKSFSKNFVRTENLIQLQIDLFSNRQILSERKAYISEIILKYNRLLKKQRAEHYTDIKMNSNLNLKSSEGVNIFLDERIKDIDYNINIFQIHYNFIEETLNTIDRMIFGIKHRIQIQEMITQ